MMQNKRALSASESQDEINISPLIDMVFILLIFFIVTTVFVEEPGVEVMKPEVVSANDLAKNVILIAVTSTDQVFYGGQDVGVGGVRPKVRRLLQENDDMPIIIQADQQASNGIVARLIDECKLANAKPGSIYLSTEKTGR